MPDNEHFCPNCKKTIYLEFEGWKIGILIVVLLLIFGVLGIALILILLALHFSGKLPLVGGRCPLCKMPVSEMKKQEKK